jgi:type I restriction-modification system DNA methylase subunit
MFLHNVNYDKFNIQLGNTLEEPHFATTGHLTPSSPTRRIR